MMAGQPVWALAERFPRQGEWTEGEYLALREGYPRVELTDGCLDALPMPTDQHQTALTAVLLLLVAYARRAGGHALPAGIRVRLREGRFREPDVAFLSKDRMHLRGNDYWQGADLLVEVVSPGAESRARDYVEKRHEYAEAGVGEYWIVDPEERCITVLHLVDGEYVEHGVFRSGDELTSPTQPGLAVLAAAILDAD